VNHPEESIRHSEHGEILKSRSKLLNIDSQRFSNNTTNMPHIHESLMCFIICPLTHVSAFQAERVSALWECTLLVVLSDNIWIRVKNVLQNSHTLRSLDFTINSPLYHHKSKQKPYGRETASRSPCRQSWNWIKVKNVHFLTFCIMSAMAACLCVMSL
jgi:hypothetical protein